MKKEPIVVDLPAQVHSLTNEGIGVAAVDGKTTFIEGALPQETVKYRIFKRRRHYDEASYTDIITPSPERTTPRCLQFGTCGGCSMQHLEETAQIAWKQKIFLEQLERLGHVRPDSLLPPLVAAGWEYRHKARLGVRYLDKYNKAVVGFRKKFRQQIADVDRCEVLHPQIGTRLTALSELISGLDCKEQLPQIEVAVGDQEAALIFRHLIPLSAQDHAKLQAFGQQHQIHIYLQPNPPQPITLLWPENSPHRLHYRLPDFNIEILFHPADFTQIHLEINRLMVAQAVRLLDPKPHETLLDLFCGVGNFSLPLARFARQVIGIEGSALMVERAYENARHNAISNVEFLAENLFAPSPEKSWYQQRYEKILLDPPRSGAQEIIGHFPHFAPQRIVYVSCNPATLARDAGILVHQQGYRLKQAGIMNMFPHTSHIESMAVFEKT